MTVRQRAVIAVLLDRSPDDLDLELALATLNGLAMDPVVGRHGAAHTTALVERSGKWIEALPKTSAAPSKTRSPGRPRDREP